MTVDVFWMTRNSLIMAWKRRMVNPPEDEESLESIRAAVKNKIKQYKVTVDCDKKLL